MKKMVKMCWSTSVDDRDSALNKGSKGKVKGLLWYKSLGHHMFGEFSMGVMQANSTLEDQSQVECGPLGSLSSGPIGTFIGIYDGHGGPQAAHFANNNLFKNLKRCTNDRQEISADAIRKAFMVTEEEFISMVRQRWLQKPTLASSGTCCLAGIICNGEIYTANAGDSRVVLGTINRVTKRIEAIQLSNDHNAQIESEREELRSCHPHDPNIVVMKHKAWRVKGIIQVTRSIGDAYLKSSEFNREPLLQRYRVSGPLYMPILRAQPSISVRKLENEDQFLVFASDGLWENLSNNEVVDIVSKSPRFGIARKLIKAALKRAANKREMRYSDLKKIDAGVRRHFHDDITVVVVFIDHSLLHRSAAAAASPFSIKGGAGAGIAGVSQGGPVAVGDCSN